MESAHHQSPYGFHFFAVHQIPLVNFYPQVEEESEEEESDEEESDAEESAYTTVRMRLWKMSDESGAYELAGSSDCRVWRNEVALREEWPTLMLKTHLTELGVVLEEDQLEAIEALMQRLLVEDVIIRVGMLVVMDMYEQWYHQAYIVEEPEMEVRTVPASEAAIAALDKVKVEEGVVLYCCAICMEEDEERFSRMPCTHVFHTECVKKWLRISSSCPICRYEMPVED